MSKIENVMLYEKRIRAELNARRKAYRELKRELEILKKQNIQSFENMIHKQVVWGATKLDPYEE